MRSLISAFLLAGLAHLSAAEGWRGALRSAGYDAGEVTFLTGAEGAQASGRSVQVHSVTDTHDPRLEIIWEKPEVVPVYRLPDQARVFAKEAHSGAPLLAGWLDNGRAVLWSALPVEGRGYERFPYLPQALRSLGRMPRLEARDLWVFFDSSYRLRADLEYLARRWRKGGVAALHVAAWHYWEPDEQRDAWLRRLIEICHNNAILVYAWVEFPHVSEQFWREHPEWREKTASGQDAHLDWRMLMDLTDPDCAAAAALGLRALVHRFDWDGLNLGELYFESLEGAANPARFTPFAVSAQRELRKRTGFSPLEALQPGQEAKLRQLLEARVALAADLQKRWLGELAGLRGERPHLDLVLTHIDDRFDPSMRDKLGADAAALLPHALRAGSTFLIEDPANLWHLGPDRYAEIARRYKALTSDASRLAIDLNIVERYQDVYPTKRQTGVELFQLVRQAAHSFHRVALYFENSISRADWPLLAASAATAQITGGSGGRVQVDAPRGGRLAWSGGAKRNGAPWPASDGESILLPAGRSVIEAMSEASGMRLCDFNGLLLSAKVMPGGKLEIAYESRARAVAIVESPDKRERRAVMLPPGAHTKQIERF